MIKTITNKNAKKAKWLSEKALQIAEKRREAKGKQERERYIHLNAEFQRIAKRDKKAFLSDQCKEIEENNKMGKTRAIFRKINCLMTQQSHFWAYTLRKPELRHVYPNVQCSTV